MFRRADETQFDLGQLASSKPDTHILIIGAYESYTAIKYIEPMEPDTLSILLILDASDGWP